MQLEFPPCPHLLILTGLAHARVQFYLGLGKRATSRRCAILCTRLVNRPMGPWVRVRIGVVVEPACLAACHTTTMVALCNTRAGWHATGFPLGQVSSPVSFYLWRMTAGRWRARRAGQAQSGKRARLTQLRGIASGGCLGHSGWKSTIVPYMNAVSEAHRSFKNPTLSRKSTTAVHEAGQAGLAGLAGQHNCPRHIINMQIPGLPTRCPG